MILSAHGLSKYNARVYNETKNTFQFSGLVLM